MLGSIGTVDFDYERLGSCDAAERVPDGADPLKVCYDHYSAIINGVNTCAFVC